MSSGSHSGQSSMESWASVELFQELSSKFISISWVSFRTVIMKMTFAPCSLRSFLSHTTEMTTLRHSLHLQLWVNPQRSCKRWRCSRPELAKPFLGSPGNLLSMDLSLTFKTQGIPLWGSLEGFYQAWIIYRNFSCPEAAHQDSRRWLIRGISTALIWCWHPSLGSNTPEIPFSWDPNSLWHHRVVAPRQGWRAEGSPTASGVPLSCQLGGLMFL